MSRSKVCLAMTVVCALATPYTTVAQTCYTRVTSGGAATINRVAAVEDVGTLAANMNAVENDGNASSYYSVSTFAGPASVTMATALVSGSIADNDKAPLGLTFINGGPSAVKIRRVVVQSDRTGGKLPLFRSAPKPDLIDPLIGAWVVSADKYDAVWTAPAGGYTISAKSAQAFLANIYVSNVKSIITDDVVGGTITTCASVCDGSDDITTYVAQGYETDLFVPSKSEKVATAMVSFVDAGTFPRTTTQASYGPTPPLNLIGGQPGTLTVRVKEWSGNEAIRAGLGVTITLPAQWTNVSVSSAGAPWDITTANVSGSSAIGWTVTISTNAVIAKGNTTGDIVITATPPSVFTKSTFQAKAQLNGFDDSNTPPGGHLIRSVCDGGGTILPDLAAGGAQNLNVEFFSPRLNAGGSNAPVEQVDFRADFNVTNNAAPINVTVQAYNVTSSAWQSITGTPVAPGTGNVTITQSFSGAALYDLLDDQMRMKVRFTTDTSDPQTLRIDHLLWDAQTYWVVDSAAGNDNWPSGTKFAGSTVYPFKTLAKANGMVTSSERVRVLVGGSQSGTPYDSNIIVGATAAGTAQCKTWFEGVASGSQLPKIYGVPDSYGTSWGFDVAADHVKVSGFRLENTLYALLAEAPSAGVTFADNEVKLIDYGAGIVLNNYSTPVAASTSLEATNNLLDGSGSQAFFGIYDAGAQGSLIDGNRVIGIPNFSMYLDGASSPVIQRNVVTGGYLGIYLARTAGAKLYNNSADLNSYRGVHLESSTGATSRNNIISRNAIGFSADSASSVSSDYDDVYANGTGYQGVTAGVNSLAADPQWVQTSDRTLATYYRLSSSSSPCANRGTVINGITYLGAAPDVGAVESY